MSTYFIKRPRDAPMVHCQLEREYNGTESCRTQINEEKGNDNRGAVQGKKWQGMEGTAATWEVVDSTCKQTSSPRLPL